jgi:cell division protein FtsB
MVNEIIKHLNSIGEVNLSAQKIELSVISDLANYSSKANGLESKVSKLESDFDNAEKILSTARKELNSLSKEAEIITDVLADGLDKILKQSKELGINVNDVPVYKEAKNAYSRVNIIPALIKEYQKPV